MIFLAHGSRVRSIISGDRTIRIVEVGSWKDRSTTTMADFCRKFRPEPLNCTLLAIDTWLGPGYLYMYPGHPSYNDVESTESLSPLYETFLKNVKVRGLQQVVRPFRFGSSNAARVLRCYRMKADFVYIDGDPVRGGQERPRRLL